jgi:hypothetical protein
MQEGKSLRRRRCDMQSFLSLLMLFLLRIGIPLMGSILVGTVMNRISNSVRDIEVV